MCACYIAAALVESLYYSRVRCLVCVSYFMVKGGPVQVSPYIVHVGLILCEREKTCVVSWSRSSLCCSHTELPCLYASCAGDVTCGTRDAGCMLQASVAKHTVAGQMLWPKSSVVSVLWWCKPSVCCVDCHNREGR